MVKVLAIVEIDLHSTSSSDQEINDTVRSAIEQMALPDDSEERDDAIGYLGDAVRDFTDVTVLSTRVLNSHTESVLNHLYPHFVIDLETEDGPTRRLATPAGPAPTWEEALLFYGTDPSKVQSPSTRLSAESVQTHPAPHEPVPENRDSACAQALSERQPGQPTFPDRVQIGADYEGIERRVMGHMGFEAAGAASFDFPPHVFTRPHSLNAPSRRPIPNDRVEPDLIEVKTERVLEITDPLGVRYTIPMDYVPDPLKEESEMLKKLRDFFTDPFKRSSRIPGVAGTVTGRVAHTPSPARTADDLTAAVLMHAILTNDDLSKANDQAAKVIGMANDGLDPVRTKTEFYDEAILRDPTPVETSRPVADEDRSAAAAIESRPVETSSYRDDTPSSSSWADSSSSSSSDSYSSSGSSDSYSSSSVD